VKYQGYPLVSALTAGSRDAPPTAEGSIAAAPCPAAGQEREWKLRIAVTQES